MAALFSHFSWQLERGSFGTGREEMKMESVALDGGWNMNSTKEAARVGYSIQQIVLMKFSRKNMNLYGLNKRKVPIDGTVQSQKK